MTDPKPLTPAQRAGLRLASRKGGVHVGAGKDAPEKRVTKPVARLMVAAGFAVQHEQTLLVTKAGRAELDRPTPEVPVYLRQRDGLTTRRALSVRDEPEVVRSSEARNLEAERRRQASLTEAQQREQAAQMAHRLRRAA